MPRAAGIPAHTSPLPNLRNIVNIIKESSIDGSNSPLPDKGFLYDKESVSKNDRGSISDKKEHPPDNANAAGGNSVALELKLASIVRVIGRVTSSDDDKPDAFMQRLVATAPGMPPTSFHIKSNAEGSNTSVRGRGSSPSGPINTGVWGSDHKFCGVLSQPA